MLRSTNHLAREGLRSWTTTTTPLCSRRVAWLPRARNSRIMSQPQIHFSIARSSMAAAHHGQYRASAYVPGDVHGGYLKGPRSWTKGSALGNVGPLILTRGLQAGSTRGRTSFGSSKPGDRPFSDKKPNDPTPDNVPPEDGLTRYPTLSSPQGILRGLDYMGTTVFALSGTVTAGQTGMDLLGCVVVGTITATGGGTVRDLLLGNNPVFWMQETEYLWMCVLTSISVFFLWSYFAEHGVRDDMALLNWADAMGVGAFCCIGTQAAIRKGLSQIVCVACGMLTSTFGGVIRDVLCSRPPRILFSHAEIYASTALFGSMVYILARASGLSPVGRIVCGFLGGAGLRVLAFTTDIRLPSWVEPSTAAIESGSDGQNKGDEVK